MPLACSTCSSFVPLLDQYRQIGVDFVRTHDIVTAFDINEVFPDMKADPSDGSSYYFGETDAQVRAIISIDAQVLYRLGWAFNYGGPRVPNNNTRFAEICKHIVMHYNLGWANGFHYGIRYWEIMNEPDLRNQWDGTPEQYFKLYDTIARTVKSVDAETKVGGPALAYDMTFLQKFLQFCKANQSPLDFVSWHIYPEREPYVVPQAAHQVQDLLTRYGFKNAENFITEWNFSPGGAFSGGGAIELYNARGAAWASSVLAYLQDTPVSRAFWYRGNPFSFKDFSLFLGSGGFRKSGYAFLAMKKMLETPVRLACNGSDKAGFATLAGISESNQILRVLISNYDSDYGEFTLSLRNLNWPAHTLKAQIYLLNDTYDLALIDQFQLTKAEPLAITRNITPSSVYLVSFEPKEAVTAQTTALERSTSSNTTLESSTGITVPTPVGAGAFATGSFMIVGVVLTMIIVAFYLRRHRE